MKDAVWAVIGVVVVGGLGLLAFVELRRPAMGAVAYAAPAPVAAPDQTAQILGTSLQLGTNLLGGLINAFA